jgi:Flp pilus assembly protein TadD
MFIAAATWAAFFPSLRNGFVNWDDPPNLIDNPHVRGFSADNVKWMLTAFHLGHYQPLTWFSFGLDYVLAGSINAREIHLTSLVFHTVNALLFFFLCRRLLRLVLGASGIPLQWGAALAALLFALHPLRVESVAWATERRDVVSGMFFMLTLLAYLRWASPTGDRRRFWLVLAVLLHTCACGSKVICVTLPAVIIVLDVYPLRRLGGAGRWWGAPFTKVWMEKIPFLAVTLAASVIAFLAQGQAMTGFAYMSMDLRLAYTPLGLVFYLYKFFLPVDLIPIYEIRHDVDPLAWRFLASAIVLLGITVVLLLGRRRFPSGLALWVAYLALLSPVTSITQNGAQFAADRYSYLSGLTLALLMGGGLAMLLRAWGDRPGLLTSLACLAAGVIGGLGGLTWRQTQLWHDSLTLWRATLAVDPDSWVANRNLADALMDADRVEQAADYYRRALAVEQRNVSLHSNAAIAFARLGSLVEADRHVRLALRLSPTDVNSLTNAAYVKMQMKQFNAAIEIYHRALQHYPDNVNFLSGLGAALANNGDHAQAIQPLRRAVSISPEDPKLYRLLAVALLETGRLAEAEEIARRTLELNPQSKPAAKLLKQIDGRRRLQEVRRRVQECRHLVEADPGDREAALCLADALAGLQLWDQAAEQYSKVLASDPGDAEVRLKLARVLIESHRDSQAVDVLQDGIDLGYGTARMRLKLVHTLATSADAGARDGARAVRLAEELLQADPHPGRRVLAALATAYAEAGRFTDAERACLQAIELAKLEGAETALRVQRERLELYRAGKPFHQPAPGLQSPVGSQKTTTRPYSP